MRNYTAKTIDEAIEIAAIELGVEKDRLAYEVVDEKKGLFKKEATIAVYTIDDAASYAEEYLKNAIGAMGIEVKTSSSIEDEIIKVSVDSERNPVLIGKGGRTLQALNELTRLAVSNKFKKRYRVLLDVGSYKEEKYDHISYLAKRSAKEVLRSKTDVTLSPMTPDERRIVHNTLSDWEHIKTESTGEGRERAVVIKYVD